tara:strand:+ start:54 stop:470 length:417 start_codon:yes stop_codon:yes gene_type:complete
MHGKIKLIFLIFTLAFFTQCSGTGSKIKPVISNNNSGTTNLYFSRQGGFVASGVLAKIEVNGSEIGRLGINEHVKHSVSGSFRIKVSGAGIGGLGMGQDTVSGIGDGRNYFYIISVKQGLLSTKWIINETTESGFKTQ